MPSKAFRACGESAAMSNRGVSPMRGICEGSWKKGYRGGGVDTFFTSAAHQAFARVLHGAFSVGAPRVRSMTKHQKAHCFPFCSGFETKVAAVNSTGSLA